MNEVSHKGWKSLQIMACYINLNLEMQKQILQLQYLYANMD